MKCQTEKVYYSYVESKKKIKQMNKQSKTKTKSQIQRTGQLLPEGSRLGKMGKGG